jgi:hypothetical protein
MAGKAVIGADSGKLQGDDSKAIVLAQPKPLAIVPPKHLTIVCNTLNFTLFQK